MKKNKDVEKLNSILNKEERQDLIVKMIEKKFKGLLKWRKKWIYESICHPKDPLNKSQVRMCNHNLVRIYNILIEWEKMDEQN